MQSKLLSSNLELISRLEIGFTAEAQRRGDRKTPGWRVEAGGWKRHFRGTFRRLVLLVLILGTARSSLAETNGVPMFLGESSCSSSSCHGGAGEKKEQYFTWANKDFHSKSYATLTMARSARIAEGVKISDPTRNERCTVCHAPFFTVPAAELSKGIDPTVGVSCESCHGRAENWIRSHTRTDFTHMDRVHAGMRDLQNIYVRANSCVACHQNVDADLFQAGHPELIFELDGQLVSQPRHWREKSGWSGPQTWLVGQAVALREMSWHVAKTSGGVGKGTEISEGSPSPLPNGLPSPPQVSGPKGDVRSAQRGPPGKGEAPGASLENSKVASSRFSGSREVMEKIQDRWAALLWLVQRVGTMNGVLPSGGELAAEPSAANAERAQKRADEVARAASAATWTDEMTRQCLAKLAGSAGNFRDKSVTRAEQGRRAERLVLALDRLVMGLNDPAKTKRLDEPLNRLFADAQSLPNFDPEQFAGHLEEFQKAMEGK